MYRSNGLFNCMRCRPRCSRRQAACMQLNLARWDSSKNGPASRKAILGRLRDQGYSCTTYTFPPGTVFGDHSHGVDKKDAILSGRFLFRMGGEEVILEPGDMLEVPKGKTHYASVVGDQACEFVDASKLDCPSIHQAFIEILRALLGGINMNLKVA